MTGYPSPSHPIGINLVDVIGESVFSDYDAHLYGVDGDENSSTNASSGKSSEDKTKRKRK